MITSLIPNERVRCQLFDALQNIKEKRTRQNAMTIDLLGFGDDKKILLDLIHATCGGVKQSDSLILGNTTIRCGVLDEQACTNSTTSSKLSNLRIVLDNHGTRTWSGAGKRRCISVTKINQDMIDSFKAAFAIHASHTCCFSKSSNC